MSFQALRRFKKQASPDRTADWSTSNSNSSPSSSSSDLPRLQSLSNSLSTLEDSPRQLEFGMPRRSSTDSDDPTLARDSHDTSPTLVSAATFHSHRVAKRSSSASGSSSNSRRMPASEDVSRMKMRLGESMSANSSPLHFTDSSSSLASKSKTFATQPRTATIESILSGSSNGEKNGHSTDKSVLPKKKRDPVRLEDLTYVPTKEFDNDQGDLKFAENDLFVDVDNKRSYRVVNKIGSGTFGQVVRVTLTSQDHDSKANGESPSRRAPTQQFAIKIIKNKEAYHAQALKETNILQRLNSRWDPDGRHNIVRLLSVFYDKGHLMLVFPVLGCNLYELLRGHQHRGFKTSVVQVFIQQVVEALKCLAQAGIVHTDLKPENILLESSDRWKIKVIDFGSASYENHNASTYIQSRFYRAPEVILGVGYNRAIDMWSVGCIAAELFLGLPLFPGKNEFNQLRRITKVLKDIPQAILAQGSRTNLFYENPGEQYVMKDVNVWATENNTKPVAMTEYFPGGSLEEIIMARNLSASTDTRVLRHEHHQRILLIDFIRKCLEFDFGRRMTPDHAQRHQFLNRPPSHQLQQGAQSGASFAAQGVGVNALGQQVPVAGRGVGMNAAQAYKFYNPQQMALAAMQRQQELARYQIASQQAAMSRQFYPGGGVPNPPPDMNAIIAARKQNPPQQRWRHKSYDVGQHMRAEEQAKRRRRLAAKQASNGQRPAATSDGTRATAPQAPGVPRMNRPTSHGAVSARPRQSGLRVRHSSASAVITQEQEKRRRGNQHQPAPREIPAELIQRMQAGRDRKRSERRKRYNQRNAKGVDESSPITDWGARSMGDLAGAFDKQRKSQSMTVPQPNQFLPRQSSEPSVRTRGRSNTAPQITAPNLPPVAMLTTSATHAQTHFAQPEIPPIPTRRLHRHSSQPMQNGGDMSFMRNRQRGQRRAHRRTSSGSSNAQANAYATTVVPTPQQHYPPQARQETDYYGQYMHESISARGQEHINELGQRTRHLRTWQTPQTRYF